MSLAGKYLLWWCFMVGGGAVVCQYLHGYYPSDGRQQQASTQAYYEPRQQVTQQYYQAPQAYQQPNVYQQQQQQQQLNYQPKSQYQQKYTTAYAAPQRLFTPAAKLYPAASAGQIQSYQEALEEERNEAGVTQEPQGQQAPIAPARMHVNVQRSDQEGYSYEINL